jgi:hypothetical protein
MRRTAGLRQYGSSGQLRQLTHASHDGIGQQSLEWDTHDCGMVCSVAVGCGGVVVNCELDGGPRRLWKVRPVLGLAGFSTYAKGAISDDEIAPTPDTD